MAITLYIDATIAVSSARDTVVCVFGPFSDRRLAEEALVAFIARENSCGAIIRNPDPSTEP